ARCAAGLDDRSPRLGQLDLLSALRRHEEGDGLAVEFVTHRVAPLRSSDPSPGPCAGRSSAEQVPSIVGKAYPPPPAANLRTSTRPTRRPPVRDPVTGWAPTASTRATRPYTASVSAAIRSHVYRARTRWRPARPRPSRRASSRHSVRRAAAALRGSRG